MKRNNEKHANDLKDFHYHRVAVHEHSGRTWYDLGHLCSWESSFNFSVLSSLQDSQLSDWFCIWEIASGKAKEGYSLNLSWSWSLMKWVDLPGIMPVIWTQLALMESVYFPLEGHGWSSRLSAQGHHRKLGDGGWGLSPLDTYLWLITSHLWTLGPPRDPRGNLCCFVASSSPRSECTVGDL